MPLVAIHPQKGRLEAWKVPTGLWTDLKQSEDRKQYTLMCGSTAIMKNSKLGTQFFAHKANSTCSTHSPESREHLALKTHLAKLAYEAGFNVTTEEPAEDRSWIADVMIEKNGIRTAIEVQLSPQNPVETILRSEKYYRSGINVIWFFGGERQHNFEDLLSKAGHCAVILQLRDFQTDTANYAPKVVVPNRYQSQVAGRFYEDPVTITTRTIHYLTSLRRHLIMHAPKKETTITGFVAATVDDQCGNCGRLILHWSVSALLVDSHQGIEEHEIPQLAQLNSAQGDWKRYIGQQDYPLNAFTKISRNTGSGSEMQVERCPYCGTFAEHRLTQFAEKQLFDVRLPAPLIAPFFDPSLKDHWCRNVSTVDTRCYGRGDLFSDCFPQPRTLAILPHSLAHGALSELERLALLTSRAESERRREAGLEESAKRAARANLQRKQKELEQRSRAEAQRSAARNARQKIERVRTSKLDRVKNALVREYATQMSEYFTQLKTPIGGIKYQEKLGTCEKCKAVSNPWKVLSIKQGDNWVEPPQPSADFLGMKIEEIIRRGGMAPYKLSRYSHANLGDGPQLVIACRACVTTQYKSFADAPGSPETRYLETGGSFSLYDFAPQIEPCTCGVCKP